MIYVSDHINDEFDPDKANGIVTSFEYTMIDPGEFKSNILSGETIEWSIVHHDVYEWLTKLFSDTNIDIPIGHNNCMFYIKDDKVIRLKRMADCIMPFKIVIHGPYDLINTLLDHTIKNN